MKILLIQCPSSYGIKIPPLGLAYLFSFLKENNYDVSILDLNIILYESVNEQYKFYWDNNQSYHWYLKEIFDSLPFINEQCYIEFVKKILSLNSDILCFSIQHTSALFTLEIIKRIKLKEPSKKIILGGPNCYNLSRTETGFRLQNDLQKFANIIVVGEGEKTLLNILQHIKFGKPLYRCSGVAVPIKRKWVFKGFAKPIVNLDKLPFPDFTDYNLKAYIDKYSLPILMSRGCIMKCIFCTDTYFWNPYRSRSAENVVLEIVYMQKKYKNRFFEFNDSLINGNYETLLELCNILTNKKLDISWGGNCRADKRLDLEFLKKMKGAGCNYLIVGIESGSNKILKLMRKGITIKEAERFIYDCNKAGIDVNVNWIIGFIDETEEDFMETVKFIIKHKDLIKTNNFSTLAINPFSYLARHKEEFNIFLDEPHLGLWRSEDGLNTIELRNSRLSYLEDIERKRNRSYNVIRQTENNSC